MYIEINEILKEIENKNVLYCIISSGSCRHQISPQVTVSSSESSQILSSKYDGKQRRHSGYPVVNKELLFREVGYSRNDVASEMIMFNAVRREIITIP
jgi:hypothetical protein